MAATAGTRKRKRAATGGAGSTAATTNKKKRARVASVEWVEVPPTSGSHASCCCYWCVTMPSRRCSGPDHLGAGDPATMTAVASPVCKPLTPVEHSPSMHSGRAASPDPTPPTPWNSPASTPSPDYKPSIQAEYAAWAHSSSRAASPDPTPPTPWNSPATASSGSDYNPSSPSECASLTIPTSPVTLPEYTLSITSEYRPSLEYTPASPSEYNPSIPAEYKPSVPAEYAVWAWSSYATSPDPTPPTPWNSPATPSSPEYTPSSPSEYAPLTPTSGTLSPAYTPPSLPDEYTPSSPWSRAASPYYTPATPHAASPDYTPSRGASLDLSPSNPSGRAFSPSSTPSTPPPSPKLSDDDAGSPSSSRRSSRASKASRRGRRCLPTKTYRAFFSPRVSAV